MKDVIETRELSDERAEKEILNLFGVSETPLYFSDIEERLAIDIEQVVRVCRKLILEEKVI